MQEKGLDQAWGKAWVAAIQMQTMWTCFQQSSPPQPPEIIERVRSGQANLWAASEARKRWQEDYPAPHRPSRST